MKINSINSINTNLNSQKRHPQFQGIVLSKKASEVFDKMYSSPKASISSIMTLDMFLDKKIILPQLGKEGKDIIIKINDFTDEFVDGARKVSINYEVPALAKLGLKTQDAQKIHINVNDTQAELPELLLEQEYNSLGIAFKNLIDTIKRKANLDI